MRRIGWGITRVLLMTNFKTLAALMMTALMAAGTASAADGKFGADRHAGERQKFCVHGIIGARQTGASNEHEHQTQFS